MLRVLPRRTRPHKPGQQHHVDEGFLSTIGMSDPRISSTWTALDLHIAAVIAFMLAGPQLSQLCQNYGERSTL